MKAIEAWAVGIALVVAIVAGWMANQWRWDAKWEKQQKDDAQHLAQEQVKTTALQHQLDTAHAQVTVKTITLTHEVTHVVTRYIPAPGAASQARPAYYLTVGSLRLWDAALYVPGTAPEPAGAGAADGSPDPLSLSGVSFEDALDNHVRNAATCEAMRLDLVAWQTWWKSVSAPAP